LYICDDRYASRIIAHDFNDWRTVNLRVLYDVFEESSS
jgi:hypothetical protein